MLVHRRGTGYAGAMSAKGNFVIDFDFETEFGFAF